MDQPPVSTDAARDTSTTMTALPAVEIQQVRCPALVTRDDGLQLSCGAATVPIDRSDGSLGSVQISISTLAGTDNEMTTPVAVLQGGPGGASTGLGAWFPQRPFTQVFVDQRGTGFVGPEFDCPEIIDALGAILSTGSAEATARGDAAYDECALRLQDDIVLQHTDSESHAADVADVMTALGYSRWVAYGVSYGSTIGLELLRDEPPGLAGVVLDGVYPPELDTDLGLVFSANRAVDVVDAACAAEPTCSEFLADGSFAATLERVMAELDADPIEVSVSGAEIGYPDSVDVVLDGRRVAELSFVLMYHESLIRHLPAVVGGLDDRDASSARWLARVGSRLLVSSMAANHEGTYFAVQCHDRVPFTDGPGEGISGFAAAVVPMSLAEVCEAWERSPAAGEVGDPVLSSVPTLLLSGEFDPIVPARYAEDAAARLASATTVEQGGRGHGIWYGNDCIAQLVLEFASDPTADLDTSCADLDVPVEWARP